MVLLARSISLALPNLTSISQNSKVTDDPLELCTRHADGRLVLHVGNAQMVRLNVHELQVKVADSLGVGRLKHEGEDLGSVLGLEGDGVVVSAALQDLAQVGGVEAKGNLAV